MAKSVAINYDNCQVADNTSRYVPVIGAMNNLSGGSTEKQLPVRYASTFRNLQIYVPENTTTTVTSTATLMKNASATAVTLSVGAGLTGIFEDTTHSVAFANTDLVNMKYTVPSEAGALRMTVSVLGVEIEPDDSSKCITWFACVSSGSFTFDSATRYIVPAGTFASSTAAEGSQKYRFRISTTLKYLFVEIGANTRSTTSTIGVRKNGANGNQTLSIGAGLTGQFEDTSNTDSFAAGDDFNFFHTHSTGGGGLSPRIISCVCESANGEFPMVVGSNVGMNVTYGTSDLFVGAAGYLNTTHTTEANTQFLPRFFFVAKELGARASTNNLGSGSTVITVRDNSADSALTITFPSSTAGLIEDTTNKVPYVSGTDKLNIEIDPPTTEDPPVENLVLKWIGIVGFTNVQTASVSPVTAALSVPAVTAKNIATASVSPVTANFSVPTVTASYTSGSTFTAYTLGNTDPAILDSYSEANQNTLQDMYSSSYNALAQSFSSGAGGDLYSQKLYLKKTGSPTGNAIAKLYAATGSHGTTAKPTGAALATSESLDVSTLTTSFALVEFRFINGYQLSAATTYCISIEYSGGDASNKISVGQDNSSPTHAGNLSRFFSGAWSEDATYDQVFYVYTAPRVPLVSASIPSVTATYAAVISASAAPVTATFSVPSVSATHRSTASVSPVSATFSVPTVTASHQSGSTASVSPVVLSLSVPSVTALGQQIVTASVSPLTAALSVPSVSATFAIAAAVSPVVLVLTVAEVSAFYEPQALFAAMVRVIGDNSEPVSRVLGDSSEPTARMQGDSSEPLSRSYAFIP